MKKIGMIVAMKSELESALESLGTPTENFNEGSFEISKYEISGNEVFILQSGIGEIAAAAASQLLISVYECEMIINYGIVGGLTPEMSLAKTCVVEKVVHYDFNLKFDNDMNPVYKKGEYPDFDGEIFVELDRTLIEIALKSVPELKRVTCASADKFVDTDDERKSLHDEFGADICEMELGAIAITCKRNGVPCLSLKSVSDAIGEDYDFKAMTRIASDACVKVLVDILKTL